MRSNAKKVLQPLTAWVVALGILWFAWPAALGLAQIWILMGISILANVLQPSYRILEGPRVPEDRWTAAQILWTVYLTQIAALVELAVKRPTDLPMGWVSWGAVAVMVGGLVLRTWSVLTLRGFFTWNIEVKPGQTIIQSGPYRVLRHPSYSGAFLIFVGGCVLLSSWVATFLAVVALSLAFHRRIRHEERLLRETFPEYDDYASRTGGMLPRMF